MHADRDEAVLNAIADTLPDGEPALLQVAKAAIYAYDAAIIADQESEAEAARGRYAAVIWKLNGRTNFASYGDHDAPGYRVARHCAALSGEPPRWGQACEFMVEADGLTAILKGAGGFSLGGSYGFHVPPDRIDDPWISNTGFRSYLSGPIIWGASFPVAAQIWLRSLIKSEKLTKIPADAFVRTRPDNWPWLSAPAKLPGADAGLMAFPF